MSYLGKTYFLSCVIISYITKVHNYIYSTYVKYQYFCT